jgi:MoxR-like ATPase
MTRARELEYVRTPKGLEVAQSIEHRHRIPLTLVFGEIGTGKTYTVLHELLLAGVFYRWITCAKGVRLGDYIGHWELENGATKFQKGILYEAIEKAGENGEGGIVVLDDCHQLGNDLQYMNSACDTTNRKLSVPEVGVTLDIPDGLSFILIANPQKHLPPWERGHAAIPPQILSRARVILFEAALPLETELEILKLYWPSRDGLGDEAQMRKLLDLVRKLRENGQLESYTPAIRDLVIFATLLDIGVNHRDAFAQAIGHKYSTEDQIAVWTAYNAAFPAAA